MRIVKPINEFTLSYKQLNGNIYNRRLICNNPIGNINNKLATEIYSSIIQAIRRTSIIFVIPIILIEKQ